ncbi:MAG: hypothetical protein PHN56_06105, partial [Candidatus Nanoarchaeia archaeon]|nr:hypothetical protein [Candidatus Nanoarchaeia archaeon]
YGIKKKFSESGFNGGLINEYQNSLHHGRFKGLICSVYHLPVTSDIFASHFWRGATLGVEKYKRVYKKIYYDIPILGRGISRFQGIIDKKKWIKICKKIVDEQTNVKN